MDRNIDFDTDSLLNFCNSCRQLYDYINKISIAGNGEPYDYYDDKYDYIIKENIKIVSEKLQKISNIIEQFIEKIELADVGDDDFAYLTSLIKEDNKPIN